MRRTASITLCAGIVIVCLLVSGCTTQAPQTPSGQDQESLLVYCGAGMREPMDEIAALFTEQTGIDIEYTYSGSAQLLSQIELYQTGDAYMPGAKSYIDTAIEKGFVDRTEPTVYHVLSIVVPTGNPADIQTVYDLAKPGVRVAIGEPSGPAIGKAARKMLEKDGIWAEVENNTVVKSGTVNELLVYISMGQADAAIIWEDLFNPETMEKVDIPMEEGFVKVVPIGTLTFSENPENAGQFIDFVTSDEGLAIFEKHGFTTYPDPKYES